MSVNLLDIERKIEARFVRGLRAIFEIDDIFGYNEDDTQTKVIISSDFPEKSATLKTPQIVVSNIGFQFNMNNSFASNYYEDVVDSSGVIVGEKYVNVVPYSLGIMCLGEFYISKDLANRVASYITFTAKEVFDVFMLNIQNVNKSPSSPKKQYGEHIFETAISVQGYVNWSGTKTTDRSVLDVVNKLKLEMQLSANI